MARPSSSTTGPEPDISTVASMDMVELWDRVCSRRLCPNQAACKMQGIRAKSSDPPACEILYNLLATMCNMTNKQLVSETSLERSSISAGMSERVRGATGRAKPGVKRGRDEGAGPAAGSVGSVASGPPVVDQPVALTAKCDEVSRKLADVKRRANLMATAISREVRDARSFLVQHISAERHAMGLEAPGASSGDRRNDFMDAITQRIARMESVVTSQLNGQPLVATVIQEAESAITTLRAGFVLPVSAASGPSSSPSGSLFMSGSSAPIGASDDMVPALFRVNEMIIGVLETVKATIASGDVREWVRLVLEHEGLPGTTAKRLCGLPFGKYLAVEGVRSSITVYVVYLVNVMSRNSQATGSYAIQVAFDRRSSEHQAKDMTLARSIVANRCELLGE
jgi:hypothetical protein